MADRNLRILAGAAVGLLLVGLLVAYAGPQSIADALRRAQAAWVVAAVGAYATFFLLRGARWRALLQPADVDASGTDTVSLTAFGWLVSTYVPFKAGDVARTTMMARRRDVNLGLVGGTVVVERALDMVGLALLASGGLFYAGLVTPGGLPTWLVHAFLVAWVLPLAGIALLVWVARRTTYDPDANWLVRTGHAFLTGVRALGRAPRNIPTVLALTCLVVVAQALVYVFLVRALLPGTSFAVLATAVPLFLLSFVVAITPGHVGTYEAAFVAVFSLFGLDPAPLVGAAILTHVVTAAIATALGGIGYAYHFATKPDGAAAPTREVRVEETS